MARSVFTLRLDEELYAVLTSEAAKHRRSMNEHIAYLLARAVRRQLAARAEAAATADTDETE